MAKRIPGRLLSAPGRVVKVDLPSFGRVAGLTFNDGEHHIGNVVLDPAGFAYFGLGTAPGIMVKV